MLFFSSFRLYSKLILLLIIGASFTGFSQNVNSKILADQFFSDGSYDKALDLYLPLYKRNADLELYSQILSCYILKEEYEKGLKLSKNHFKKEPNILSLIDQSILNEKLNKQSAAEKLLKQAYNDIIINEVETRVVASRLKGFGKYKDALKFYENTAKVLKDDLLFVEERLNILLMLGRLNDFIETNLDILINYPEKREDIEYSLQENVPDDESKTLKTKILSRLQKYPSNNAFGLIYVWFSTYTGNYKDALIQIKSIDRRNKEHGRRLLEFGKKMIQELRNDIAKLAFEEVIKQGHKFFESQARKELISIKISELKHLDKEDLSTKARLILKELNLFVNNSTNEADINWAKLNQAEINAFKLHDFKSATIIIHALLVSKNSKTRADAKLLLGDIALFSQDPWEAILLYTQVEKDFSNTPKGDIAKYKVAKTSYYLGDFEWAQTQLNVLKGSTSKLIANDAIDLSSFIQNNYALDSVETPLQWYAKASLFFYQGKKDSAYMLLDSLSLFYTGHPLMDDALFTLATVAKEEKNYLQEKDLLLKLIEQYPYELKADKAIFRLAQMEENIFNNTDKAIELYEKIILDYTDSIYISQSRKKYRGLKAQINDRI